MRRRRRKYFLSFNSWTMSTKINLRNQTSSLGPILRSKYIERCFEPYISWTGTLSKPSMNGVHGNIVRYTNVHNLLTFTLTSILTMITSKFIGNLDLMIYSVAVETHVWFKGSWSKPIIACKHITHPPPPQKKLHLLIHLKQLIY